MGQREDITVSDELGGELAETYPALSESEILEYDYLSVIVVRAGVTISGNLDSAWVRDKLGLAADEEPGEYNLVLCEGDVTVQGIVQLSSNTEHNTNLAVLGNLTALELWNDGEVIDVHGDATLGRALVSTEHGTTRIAGKTTTPLVIDNSWTTKVTPTATRVIHINANSPHRGVDMAKYSHTYGALKAALPKSFFNPDGYFDYRAYLEAFHGGRDPLSTG